MNEFSLIDHYFKKPALSRDDVIFGIGDDAACLSIPADKYLVVSTDTLVADVHFCSNWDPFDIASKAVRVNVSDIAAMAATPCWITLALTLPELSKQWLERFSQGLHQSLKCFDLALIGGDTTKGPLSLTMTIFGMVPKDKALRRSSANPGDLIFVSGELGGAAQAVAFLQDHTIAPEDKEQLMSKLLHPKPRVDLSEILREYASAAIDISDGLSADLNHICVASKVGACLISRDIPVHPLVRKYQETKALFFALSGGDDYELCFTVPLENQKKLLAELKKAGLDCFPIGVIEEKRGLRLMDKNGTISDLEPRGYSHF
ncbi:MAG: thiamine-phosphate kinase [Tatlockia sp.]|nr:thiamine-phosphate kinase [Tatlockia sp.]